VFFLRGWMGRSGTPLILHACRRRDGQSTSRSAWPSRSEGRAPENAVARAAPRGGRRATARCPR
jgi:hypothetical protein